MRLGVLFLLLVASVTSAHAQCRLQRPINLGNLELLDKGITLKNARFDKLPPFTNPQRYEAGRDVLDVRLFPIELPQRRRDLLGASIEVNGKGEKLGFLPYYAPDVQVKGSSLGYGDSALYRTSHVTRFGSWLFARTEAKTELKALVQRGQLTSLELTVPVYQPTRSGALHFTGRHETLCLVSAE